MDLCKKNVVYIGGFSGVGFATCKKLMQKDIAVGNLAILDIRARPDLLNILKAMDTSINIIFIELDICNKNRITSSLRTAVDRIKCIDVLINGAGVANELNVELTVELTISINLVGLINTNVAAIPYMDKSIGGRGGMIVNIASLLGLERPAPMDSVYSATSHGVLGFTRSFSDDCTYQRTGIMMITFCQGLTETSFVNLYSVKGSVEENVQSADECALNLVKAIECGRNGIVLKSDAGELTELQIFK